MTNPTRPTFTAEDYEFVARAEPYTTVTGSLQQMMEQAAAQARTLAAIREPIAQAARLLRLWAGERQRAANRWTTEEQAAVDCAIKLEAILDAPEGEK